MIPKCITMYIHMYWSVLPYIWIFKVCFTLVLLSLCISTATEVIFQCLFFLFILYTWLLFSIFSLCTLIISSSHIMSHFNFTLFYFNLSSLRLPFHILISAPSFFASFFYILFFHTHFISYYHLHPLLPPHFTHVPMSQALSIIKVRHEAFAVKISNVLFHCLM